MTNAHLVGTLFAQVAQFALALEPMPTAAVIDRASDDRVGCAEPSWAAGWRVLAQAWRGQAGNCAL